MREIREETDHYTNLQKVKSLHQKHIALAKDAEEKGDRVLSESHYQRAEYYLHAMNEPGGSAPATTPRPPVRKSHSNTQLKPPQEGKVSPFRGNYLRSKRRNIQY